MNHSAPIHQDRPFDQSKYFDRRESEQEIDQALIAAIQIRDRNAFGQLYHRHAPWILGLAYRILGNRRDAEDLLHDVLIEIWDKAAGYDSGRGSVRSWIAIRARSRALDRIRALKVIRNTQTVETAIEAYSTEICESIENNVDHRLARSALEQLPAKQRSVLEMNYFEGLTCREIAERHAIPVGTVKSRLSSALSALRNHLKSQEDPSP